MSLDVFNPIASDQNVVQNAARDLPADFSEAFDISLRGIGEWNSSAAYSNARQRALATYYDDIKRQTGVQLPLYGMGGNVSIDELNDGIAKLPQAPDQAPQPPLSEDSINSMALARMAKAHHDSHAFQNRETTWGGTAGTVIGTLTAGLADPMAAATAPLGGAGTLSIAARALEFAFIGAGTEGAIAALNYQAREAAVPGSSKEIPGEIASAGLFGGVLGGAMGALEKLIGHGVRPLPTTVRDEVNAASSELQFHATNPFPTAAGETAHRDAVTAAVQSTLKGEPVTAGRDFFEVYHGSPYEFERFDKSKIGTGEGNQSYGHGLYFAENKDVAQDYATSLGAKRGVYDQDQNSPTLGQFLHVSPGNVYTVRINGSAERFLDWDAPLSAQPAIAEAFQNVTPKPGWVARQIEGLKVIRHEMATDPNSTGEKAYGALSRLLGSDEAASKALQDAGVPGIKYLDQGSRDVGAGSRNYVVFDDKAVTITHKDGQRLTIEEARAADRALAAKVTTPEELAIAGEKHLRPGTVDEVPNVERFDAMPGQAEDAASYWDRRLAEASPEERATLGATDEAGAVPRIHESENVTTAPSDVVARDLTPEQTAHLAAEPATQDAVLHNLDHIVAANPEAEFTTQVRQADGTYQFQTQKLADVMKEIGEFESAAKELEACVIGLEAAE